jgi:hypothetical protein
VQRSIEMDVMLFKQWNLLEMFHLDATSSTAPGSLLKIPPAVLHPLRDKPDYHAVPDADVIIASSG